ncbi:MAG: Nudix family hydrolase [Methylobacillus sp.]|jgi:8-oxo-dGTP diphosphatase|nr:Nudix family hydrolase [Methylobacillus sp.]
MSKPYVEAAVAVLRRPDGQVLLGQRPAGKPWAGWWEFPGGKIESGETPLHALQRELHEELGIEAEVVHPWLTRMFEYPERIVKLRFFVIPQWHGEPHGREGQQLSWQLPANVKVAPLLPANAPIMDALNLPPVYAITNLHEMGHKQFFAALQQTLTHGVRLIQVREKQLSADEQQNFCAEVIAHTRPHGARVLLNGDIAMARRVDADGVHLSSAHLAALPERPHDMLCAASCHTPQELAQAEKLACDFVVLSPVMTTKSHPDVPSLGWENFRAMIADYSLPVYALGGMRAELLQTVWRNGAHGIAMQRAIWE